MRRLRSTRSFSSVGSWSGPVIGSWISTSAAHWANCVWLWATSDALSNALRGSLLELAAESDISDWAGMIDCCGVTVSCENCRVSNKSRQVEFRRGDTWQSVPVERPNKSKGTGLSMLIKPQATRQTLVSGDERPKLILLAGNDAVQLLNPS